MQKEIVKKKIFTKRIHSYVERSKWEELKEIFSGAEEAGVANTLLKSASKKVGEYLYSSK